MKGGPKCVCGNKRFQTAWTYDEAGVKAQLRRGIALGKAIWDEKVERQCLRCGRKATGKR
jgi:hypothetical protein